MHKKRRDGQKSCFNSVSQHRANCTKRSISTIGRILRILDRWRGTICTMWKVRNNNRLTRPIRSIQSILFLDLIIFFVEFEKDRSDRSDRSGSITEFTFSSSAVMVKMNKKSSRMSADILPIVQSYLVSRSGFWAGFPGLLPIRASITTFWRISDRIPAPSIRTVTTSL